MSEFIPLKLTVLGWFVKGVTEEMWEVDGSGGGGYLFVNRGYPPFKKGGGLGVIHIGGNIFLL